MIISIVVNENCTGPASVGTVKVDNEYEMHFVADEERLILNDGRANDVCRKAVVQALKTVGISVFQAEKV